MKRNVRQLSKRSAVRFRRRLKVYYELYGQGLLSQEGLAGHLRPLFAFVEKVDSLRYRKKVLDDLGQIC